jgi:hypothetical protein
LDLRIKLYEDSLGSLDFGKVIASNDDKFSFPDDFHARSGRRTGMSQAADVSNYWILRRGVSDSNALSMMNVEGAVELLYCKVPEVARRQQRSASNQFWEYHVAQNDMIKIMVILALGIPSLLNVIGLLLICGFVLSIFVSSVATAAVLLPTAALTFVIANYAKVRLRRMKISPRLHSVGAQNAFGDLWHTSLR